MSAKYRYTIEIVPEEDGIGYYATVPLFCWVVFLMARPLRKLKRISRRP